MSNTKAGFTCFFSKDIALAQAIVFLSKNRRKKK